MNIDKKNVSIIIPNYNGRELLRKNLPIFLKAVRPLKYVFNDKELIDRFSFPSLRKFL